MKFRTLACWTAWLLFLGCSPSGPDLDLALARARTAHAMGRPDWERHYLALILENDPSKTNLWLQLGDAYLAGYEGSVQAAISAYRKCLETGVPKASDVKIALAKAYALQGDYAAALEALAEVAATPKTELMRAKYLLHQDPEQAWHIIEPLISQEDPVAEAFLEAAEIARVRQDWEHVRRLAEEARKISPLEPAAAYLLAQATGRLEDRSAQETYQELFSNLKAFQTAPAGTQEQARHKLSLLLGLEDSWPGDKPEFLAHRLFWCWKAGEFQASESLFAELGDASALSDRELLDLAHVAMQTHQLAKTEALLKLLAKREQVAPKDYVLIWAQWAISMRRYAEVEARMAELLAGPEPIAAYFFWRGTALLWQNREAAAEQDFRQAIHLAPWFGNYRIALAKLLLGKGSREESKSLLSDPMVVNDPAVAEFIRVHQLGTGGVR